MKTILILIFRVLEVLLFPITIVAAAWSRFITQLGFGRAVLSEKIFMAFGVLPIRDYYIEPLVAPAKHLTQPLSKERNLPGIDFNITSQLAILEKFNYNAELLAFPLSDPKGPDRQFYYNNPSYCSGDAEYLYNMIRHFKPARMIEIGSGNSTLIAIEALKTNTKETGLVAEHICVEPFLQPWLEKTKAKIVRKKVETLGAEFFGQLQKNDILFIDSSHIIRPQGDVLYEYLEILPMLKPGVIVHIHDIFSPRDYLESWIYKEHLLWNEQYIVEAFLSMNNDFEIIGAVNFLTHNYQHQIAAKCPILANQKDREPGAFWIRRK